MSDEIEKREIGDGRTTLEVDEALRRGEMAEPISATAILTSLAISAATTAASFLLTRALAPKPKPIRRGEFSGPLQIMQSEQGLMIPEIFGGDPGDGKGGCRIAPIIFWTSGIRRNVTVSRQEVGGGKGLFGGQTQTIEEVTYDIDLALMWARGPQLLKKVWGNADVIYDVDGGRSTYEGENAANTFTAPYQITSNSDASNGSEATLQNSGGGTAAVRFNAVQSNGAATRTWTLWYATTGSVSMEYSINGAAAVPIALGNTGNVYKAISFDSTLVDGVNTIKIWNKSTTLNLRIDRIYCFPGHAATEDTTGVLDPIAPVDPTYNPSLPPDPQTPYLGALTRFDRELVIDATGVHVGTINHGGISGLLIYPGNQIQLQDPTIQAAIDGEFGANSTPAYRGRAYSVHTNFSLSRWGGTVPNFTAVLENLLYKNLHSICGQWCTRVGLLTTDFDFSALTTNCRGLFVAGRRYSPAEVMDSTISNVFNCYFAEIDGQIRGLLNTGTSIVTIDDSEIGWLDDDPSEEVLPEVDTILADEIKLPRRVDVKFYDPDQDFEANNQGESRQVTEGEQNDLLDIQVTLTAQEARDLAQRTLYDAYIKGTRHRFTLPWKYLYLNPGEVITITRDEGFTHVVQLTQISGGISILQCEAVAVESAVFTQSTVPDSGSGFEQPPVPIPQMTIAALMDTPLLRDRDETENNGIGFYTAATPRTGDGVWNGASLWVYKVGWERIADFTLPATMGRQVLANGAAVALPTGQTAVFDDLTGQTPNTLTADLYGTLAPPASASETDVLNGANALLVGDEVIQYKTRTQVGGFPNRWTFSGLLRGRRGTEHQTTAHVLNERVVVLNEAVKFVPMSLNDLNKPYDYRMVSNGASLDDAATLEDVTWTGKSKQPYSVILTSPAPRDSANSLLIQPYGRSRVGGGVRSYQAGATHEEEQIYKADILNGGSLTLLNGRTRTLTFKPDMPQAAFLLSSADSFTSVDQNSFGPVTGSAFVSARTVQEVPGPDNFLQATFLYPGNPERMVIGLQKTGGTWKGVSADLNDANLSLLAPTLTGSLTMPYLVILETITPNSLRMHVYEYGTRIFSASAVPTEADYDEDFGWNELASGIFVFKIRFSFVGSSVRIQKTHAPNVPFSTLVTGKRAAEFPMFGALGIGGTVLLYEMIADVTLTTYPFPKTIYAGAQQTEDGFTPGNSIQMDMYQWSPLVGPGVKTRITL